LPGLLGLNTNTQNVCCGRAFAYFKDRGKVNLSYRKLIRLKLSDKQYHELGFTQDKYKNLDEEVEIPLKILDSINFKYECDELCPFPDCLDNLNCWETELILHWDKIEEIFSWVEVGITLDRVSKMYCIPIEDIRRWNIKRKRITDRANIYKGFQGLVKYIQP